MGWVTDILERVGKFASDSESNPAPVAIDTGLETVETQLKTDAGLWVRYRPETMLRQAGGNKIRELCDRSQAEELLAAERAENETELAIVEAAYHTRGERINELLANDLSNLEEMNILKERINFLEDDNAAKDARIKADELKILKLEEQLSSEQASHERTGNSRDEWRKKAETRKLK